MCTNSQSLVVINIAQFSTRSNTLGQALDDSTIAQDVNLCQISQVVTTYSLGRSLETYSSLQFILSSNYAQICNSIRSCSISTHLDVELHDLQVEHVGIRSSVDSHVVGTSLGSGEAASIVSKLSALERCLGNNDIGQGLLGGSSAIDNLKLLRIAVAGSIDGDVVVLASLELDRQYQVVVSSVARVVLIVSTVASAPVPGTVAVVGGVAIGVEHGEVTHCVGRREVGRVRCCDGGSLQCEVINIEIVFVSVRDGVYADVVEARLGHSERIVRERHEASGGHVRGCNHLGASSHQGCADGLVERLRSQGGLHLKALRIVGTLCVGLDAEDILLASLQVNLWRDEPVVTLVGLAVGVARHAVVPVPCPAVLVGIDDGEVLLQGSIVKAVDVGQHVDDRWSGRLGIDGERLDVAQIVHPVLGGVEHQELALVERQRLGLAVVGHGEGIQQVAGL